jgi:hypothetical protein
MTTTDIDGLLERVQALEVSAALVRLSTEYCQSLDRRDAVRFAAIWHPEATWGLDADAPTVGIDAIMSTVEAIWQGFPETHHWTSNEVVGVADSGAAGENDVCAVVRDSDGVWYMASATYTDQYVQHEGRWLIMRRDAVVHYQRPLEDVN